MIRINRILKVLVVFGAGMLFIYTATIKAETECQVSSEETEAVEKEVPFNPNCALEKSGLKNKGNCNGLWNKNELKRLKEENPEMFKRKVKQYCRKLAKRLEQLRQDDPESFEKIMRRYRLNKVRQMKSIEEKNPEKFKECLQKKKDRVKQGLNKLKEEHPQRYEKLVKCHRQMNRLRRLKKENPEKYKEVIEKYPELRDYWKGKTEKHRCQ